MAAELVEQLEALGYDVDAFEHGLHRPDRPIRRGYRVRGHGVDVDVDADGLVELLEGDYMRRQTRELEAGAELGVRDRLEQRIDQLEQAARAWPGLTPAQKDAATRAAVRGVALLARLVLRRLDSIGD